jgi:hypothetical protein
MWKEIIFLVITVLLSLTIATMSSWRTWNDHIAGVKLHDMLFELLPDLSDRFAPTLPHYLLLFQMILGLVSLFSSKKLYMYIAQFIFLQSLLTAIRAGAVAITILPMIHVDEHCEKEITSFLQALEYMVIYGTCGDFMFSGHTAIAFLTYMFVNEHNPALISGLLLGSQMLFLILLRWHYSVDILIACIITWLLFRLYKKYEGSDFWFYFKSFDNSTGRKNRFTEPNGKYQERL